eukprot:jgi/Botrbrau1/6632/Bobra.104_2s0019.1
MEDPAMRSSATVMGPRSPSNLQPMNPQNPRRRPTSTWLEANTVIGGAPQAQNDMEEHNINNTPQPVLHAPTILTAARPHRRRRQTRRMWEWLKTVSIPVGVLP